MMYQKYLTLLAVSLVLIIPTVSNAQEKSFACLEDSQGRAFIVTIQDNQIIVHQVIESGIRTKWKVSTLGRIIEARPIELNGQLKILMLEETADERIFSIADPDSGEKSILTSDSNLISIKSSVEIPTKYVAVASENEIQAIEFSSNGNSHSVTKRIAIDNFSGEYSLDNHWVSWVRKENDGLKIFVQSLQSENVFSFKTDGFAGQVRPVIVNNELSRLVWNENVAGKATVRYRTLSEDGLGEVMTVSDQDQLSGILINEQQVAGVKNIQAHGWNVDRWIGLKYQFAGISDMDVRYVRDDNQHLLNATVLSSEGKNIVVIKEEDQPLSARKLSKYDYKIKASVVSSPPSEGLISILAFGDSITEGKLGGEKSDGYIPFLKNLFEDKIGAVWIDKQGVGGEKTPDGLVRLQGLLSINKYYDYVLLLEGTNDLYYPGPLDVNGTVDTLMEMVALVRSIGAKPVLGTMLPRSGGPTPRANERAEKVSQRIIPEALENGVTLAHFQDMYPKGGEYYSDSHRNLHPSEKGYEVMATIWMPAILTFYGDLNRDMEVDGLDLHQISIVLPSRKGSYLFNPDADINDDGIINWLDVSKIIDNLGKSYKSTN